MSSVASCEQASKSAKNGLNSRLCDQVRLKGADDDRSSRLCEVELKRLVCP
jgi:hypothetical protein